MTVGEGSDPSKAKEKLDWEEINKMMEKNAKIYIAGHRGMVGSALVRCLESHGYNNLLLRFRAELDLLDQAAVRDFFTAED